jgi:predicted small integral membrane protein
MWGTEHLMRLSVTNDGAIYLGREVEQNTSIMLDNGQCGVTTRRRATVKHMSKPEKRFHFRTEAPYLLVLHFVRYIFLFIILELMRMTTVKQWHGFRHAPKITTLQIASLIF